MTGGSAGIRHGALAATALFALVAPRLIDAAPLDLLAASARKDVDDPAEDARRNFPGSAFFFAEGAFAPVASGMATGSDPHVLGLDRVDAAPALAFRGATPLDSYRALNCLTSAIYYEAGNEPEEGQRAVAQVVLNRVRSPAWPKSVCAVVYQGSERTDAHCQFTFSCDGSMARAADARGWLRARSVAQQALAGTAYRPVGLATFYHTLAVRPGWSATMRPVAVIGAHIFYRFPGAAGTPGGFTAGYTGRELISGPARSVWPAQSPAPLPEVALPAPAMAPRLDASPTPLAPSQHPDLPLSTVRPEYRSSGRPLI